MFESCFEWAADKTRLTLRAGFGGWLAAGWLVSVVALVNSAEFSEKEVVAAVTRLDDSLADLVVLFGSVHYAVSEESGL